ncbi:RNA polymerase sigma factor [Alicyclobacillus sp. ALC3]|uniref:RNA polymerase sigma factor n=1 Tax=Alicyclobacillus sp. ALC3 TaxID=2796143 RepID=UPI002378C7F0|nr:sigma-70 family RNA polymerase sigma factor [Alicyclobacillus sp. ALC3]WDL95228.1 sigma-70 family RNA polymerase sigma factor [Alicyclobacillus sp. ALC3]
MKDRTERWLVEELVAWAQDGDNAAQVAVMDAFTPLIRATASRYRHVAYEDALQEGYLSLLECTGSYNPARGVPFAAYAKSHVQGDVRTAMRRLWTVEARSVALQDYHLDDGSDWLGRSSGMAGVELRMMMEAAHLSPREAQSIRGQLMGLSCSEIAKEQGVSVETVKTWRKRAFRKLRKVWTE